MRCALVVVFGLLLLPASGQDTKLPDVAGAHEALRTAPASERFARTVDLSAAYLRAQLPDSAIAVSERALRLAAHDGQRAQARFATARGLYELQDLKGVQREAQAAIVLARAAKDTLTWLGAEGALTQVDMALDRFDPCRERAERVVLLAQKARDSATWSQMHNMLGSLAYVRHEHDSARWHYDRSIALMPASQARNRLVLLLNQVNLFVEDAQFDSALARSDAIRADILRSDRTLISHFYNQRGYTYFTAGRYREAIHEFGRSDSVNELQGDLYMHLENTGFLAESYAALGDSARAYLLMRDLEVLKDSFNRAATDERMLQLEKQFETRLNKEEIARLDQENKQKAERLQAKNVQLYGSLVVALLALGAVILVWRNLKQKRKHADVLVKLNVELKDQKERIEDINRLLRLKVLRTQMNPHFIYNSLNAIHNLVRKGEGVAASAYLDGFARLLRMVLDHSVKDRVPLEDEIAFLRQYLKLEAMRFEGGLDHSVDAEPSLLDDDLLVPALIVQPFVENAVWHGLASKQGERRLRVRFTMHDGTLVCTVEDNGVGRHAAPKRAHPDGSASVGLQLTNERLELLTFRLKESGGVTFTDLVENGIAAGTRVVVVLG